MKQYAIFSNDPSRSSVITEIFDYFSSKDSTIDCNIFSDNGLELNSLNLAILSSFYMFFYQGILIFLNLEDFLHFKNNTIASKIYLYTSMEELLSNNIDKQLLGNVSLISNQNGKIYEI